MNQIRIHSNEHLKNMAHIIVDVRINETLSIHSQPPKSLPRFYRDVPLIRGTLQISRRLKLLVNVSLFLVFTIKKSARHEVKAPSVPPLVPPPPIDRD